MRPDWRIGKSKMKEFPARTIRYVSQNYSGAALAVGHTVAISSGRSFYVPLPLTLHLTADVPAGRT